MEDFVHVISRQTPASSWRSSSRWLFGAAAHSAFFVAVFGAVEVDAQASGDPAKAVNTSDIIVTAQKRSESINKVPISLAVFGRDEILRQNAKDMGDIAAISPGVDFQKRGTFIDIDIRGISSGISGASTTGIYLDDVPVQIRLDSGVVVSTNTTPLVFDLDRVEVLRGPQGTLFGAGAEGGAVRFIQPQPSLTKMSGFARAGVSTTEGGGSSYEAGAAYGGPIIEDKIGFRLSAWHSRDGGYIDHESAIPGGAHENNADWHTSDVVRGALTFAPAETVKITPSLFYQRVHWNDAPSFDPGNLMHPDAMTANWGGLDPTYSDVGAGKLVFQGLLLQPSTDKIILPSLKIEANLPGVDLISSTSYMHRHYDGFQDFTTAMAQIFGLPWPTTTVGADYSYTPSTQKIFTQELRAQSSNPSARLQWTFGVFYNRARQNNIQYLVSPYFPTQTQQAFGQTVEQVWGQSMLPGNISIYESEPDTDTQVAGFGQATYRPFNRVSLIAGLRIARETDKYSIYINGPLNGPTSTLFAGTQKQTAIDPKFGVNVQLDDRNLIYFSAAKGDRIGGVNPPPYNFSACTAALTALGFANGNGLATYQGDSLWSYELGAKNRLFGGRLQLQASVFHIKWSDVQENLNVPACAEGFTLNSGRATSNGFDFQADLSVTRALRLGVSVGYTDARNTASIFSGGYPTISKNEQVNRYSSPWTIVARAQYDFELAGDHKGYLRLQDTYHSKNPGPYNPGTDTANPAFDAYFIPNPAYNQMDVHLGTTWSGWDISVYAMNLLNSLPLLYDRSQYPSTFEGASYTLRPRTIGLSAMYRW